MAATEDSSEGRRPNWKTSLAKLAGAAIAGSVVGFLAAVAAFFIGFESALSWSETALLFTGLSLTPAAILTWRGMRYPRAFALGLAGFWLVLAVLWFWSPNNCGPYEPNDGPGTEGGCPPL